MTHQDFDVATISLKSFITGKLRQVLPTLRKKNFYVKNETGVFHVRRRPCHLKLFIFFD